MLSNTIGIMSKKSMKISISLPDELVRYIDARVVNRSQLIESLLLAWQKKQQQQVMLAACLILDEQTSTEDDEEWQQAAVEDAIATAQLNQAMTENPGFITAVELLAM
jgi:Arc/MetJ-type ribon-helix-helix transcriptional regulator